MTKIFIPDFLHHTGNSLYIYLLQKGASEFEITIPKEKIEGKDDDYDILSEYLSAAYAGQCLSQAAVRFSYYVPCPKKMDPFYFRVNIQDMDKFSDTLYFVLTGYMKYCDDITFFDDTGAFMTNAYDEEYECNTMGLLHIANRFLIA
jgi:hypothetical protein